MVLLQQHAKISDLHNLLGLNDKKPSQQSPVKSPASDPQAKSTLASSNDLLAKAIALTVSLGLNDQQASEYLGIDQSEIAAYKASQTTADLVNQASAAATLSPEHRIARVIPTVVDKKIKTFLTTKDDKLAMAIGTELMDRHFGKPVQTTQSFGVNVQASISLDELDSKQRALQDRLDKIARDRQALKQSIQPAVDI